eukprot:7475569-Pyramimonas_sp.AAC.1
MKPLTLRAHLAHPNRLHRWEHAGSFGQAEGLPEGQWIMPAAGDGGAAAAGRPPRNRGAGPMAAPRLLARGNGSGTDAMTGHKIMRRRTCSSARRDNVHFFSEFI